MKTVKLPFPRTRLDELMSGVVNSVPNQDREDFIPQQFRISLRHFYRVRSGAQPPSLEFLDALDSHVRREARVLIVDLPLQRAPVLLGLPLPSVNPSLN